MNSIVGKTTSNKIEEKCKDRSGDGSRSTGTTYSLSEDLVGKVVKPTDHMTPRLDFGKYILWSNNSRSPNVGGPANLNYRTRPYGDTPATTGTGMSMQDCATVRHKSNGWFCKKLFWTIDIRWFYLKPHKSSFPTAKDQSKNLALVQHSKPSLFQPHLKKMVTSEICQFCSESEFWTQPNVIYLITSV